MIDSYVYSHESALYTLAVIPILSEITAAHLSVLSTHEMQNMHEITSPSRRAEFVTARVLLHTIMGHQYEPIQYEPSGKPFMTSHSVSISHTKQFVAAVVSKNISVAVDIEMYRPTIQRIASRFMNTQELQNFTTIEDQTLVWSAKEVLYKMYNASAEFAQDYTIQWKKLAQTGTIQTHIHTQTIEKTIELSYFRTLDYCLVWGHTTEI
ncbi:MAG TPA: 4'-phosphopantetheinyl transferase superfamily protein [Bacteroidales bacterium]|nr:MAG: holo-(acyl carrier protein) synthase 2 [Bacteroidetes bacterium ADurb.Bin217]HOS83641.1 4'-phosphopantetheinyl transferase superfamily protein [Bacteroidales bacterium]HPM12554.1 4'-phosphopantetheinyl transferase superfamily protein [Bacteroidales bacterium]